LNVANVKQAVTRREVDSWLGATWTNDLYDNFIRRRLDGTCNWILSCPAFEQWISSDFPSNTAKVLWVKGPAGYGKTIICASVIQHLSTIGGSLLAYYFFSSGSANRGDPYIIIRSWISQAVAYDENAYQVARERWQTSEGHTASRTDILELFRLVVLSTPNCIFVVDGLDECVWFNDGYQAADDSSPVEFLSSLKKAIAQTTSRIMILSRDEVGIRSGIHSIPANDPNQTLYEHTISKGDVQPDIEQFCKSIIDRKLANKSETLKDELSQRMVERCNGMFLWIKMQEDSLRGGKSTRQLEEIVDHAPTGLEHLYDRNWARISNLPAYDSARAFSILRWVTFALRPLTISELTEALLIADDDSCDDLPLDQIPEAIDDEYVNGEIVNLCESLVEIQGVENLGSSTVHLTHFSIKQYILCKIPTPGLSDMHRLLQPKEMILSNELAKICLRYLNFGRVWQPARFSKDILSNRPFRNYAAQLWHRHIITDGKNYTDVVELINLLFNPANLNWARWKIWFDYGDPLSTLLKKTKFYSSASPLYYASLLGLHDTVVYLTEKLTLDINSVDEYQRTALQAACSQDCISIVKILLQKGADVTTADDEGETPLTIACREGHVEAAKALLKKGASTMATANDGWSPLHVASFQNHPEIVNLLLEEGADRTAVTNGGNTPLNLASWKGNIKIMNMLLEGGGDATIEVADTNRWKPLHNACRYGHIEAVKLLLEKSVDVNVTINDGWTPLHFASRYGPIQVVKLLLEKGVDVNVIINDGWTPLHLASRYGPIQVVKLLLEKGADVNVIDNDGWTPLHFASRHGPIEAVKALLEKGADVNVINNDGWTPLHFASRHGPIEAVKALLEKGADVNAIENDGWTPLNLVSCSGYSEVAKMLLEKGASIVTITNKGDTPLHTASHYGSVNIAKVLLEKGADIAAVDTNGWTPLQRASRGGYINVVELLLNNGSELNVKGRSCQNILQVASSRGNHALMQLLIDKVEGVDIKDNTFEDALHVACINGHLPVVEQLMHLGFNVGKADEHGWTPLFCASWSDQRHILDYLVSNGGDKDLSLPVNTTPPSSWSAVEKGTSLWLDEDLIGVQYSSK
jgi:ankyrin repeat protein